MSLLDKHRTIEKNATLLLIGSFLVVTIGGIVEIAPLFYLENTIEKVEGMRPYSPLELAGRVHVRSPVPVGFEAHRSRSRSRRRPLLQRMACTAPDRAALRGAGIGHAELRLPQGHAVADQEFL